MRSSPHQPPHLLVHDVCFLPTAATLAQSERDWIRTSEFLLEMIAGVVMLAIVCGILLLRRPELKQCWVIHRRIKYYFGLTVIATTVNLVLGINGILFLIWDRDPLLLAVSWTMRQVHIALDTLVLYGALGVAFSEKGRSALGSLKEGTSASVDRARPQGTTMQPKQRQNSSFSVV